MLITDRKTLDTTVRCALTAERPPSAPTGAVRFALATSRRDALWPGVVAFASPGGVSPSIIRLGPIEQEADYCWFNSEDNAPGFTDIFDTRPVDDPSSFFNTTLVSCASVSGRLYVKVHL